MRRTWLGALAGAGVAATILIPAAGSAWAGGLAGAPAPSPSYPSPTLFPCNTGPTMPSAPPNDPPTTPGTPEIVSSIMNTVRLKWTPSTDADGIACYSVFERMPSGETRLRATFQPAVTEGTVSLPWPPSGVAWEDHDLYVEAVDTKGAYSARSGSVIVRIYNDVISPTTSPSISPPPPALKCHVTYGTAGWNGGMSSWIEVTNTGTTTISGWGLQFTFPSGGQHVTNGWSAQWVQNGATVVASNWEWNKNIAPGKSVTIGFNGTNTGTNPEPAAFYLNGTACA
ncbi:cellulose-binding domain-containing protein [Microbispora sp. RL4-1S]|uniref:Cellulose-binding domain-containing protein n=1 Tax=Microbispora oryzae TaxID=2806554 RepID=A0A941AIH5_9ACTN|nr:cellulose-binding domain-containing protein [Microbispora oryzae]MBP2703153.1 cellulose-binding domain-containing protein [Microbispora oryzae]